MGAPEVVVIVVLLALSVGLPMLAYSDMKGRGRPDRGWMLVVALVLCWPLGLVLWSFWHFRYTRPIELPMPRQRNRSTSPG